MATQPSRPWFRLATLARPPPPQQPDPPPRPAFVRPAVPRPPPNAVAPTSPPVPKASMTRASAPTPLPTVSKASHVSIPTSSPPPTISQPPSPLVLPPTKEKAKGKNSSDSDDLGMRIITIAGENKGAIMDLTPFSHKKPSSDVESNSEGKKMKLKSPLMRAIMNSNVQGVNNSILYNSSTNHHDPGVHLSLSRKPNSGIK